ncbi:MAG: AAA family ATPase [Candidatus Eisenbacteria bacterium]|nr:AAA family ATPase [Candidatus Eisenbacteria bacterium]
MRSEDVALDRIVGQDHAVSLLGRAFESGRLSHAYLFQGPEGVGKETTALELAAALNCEREGFSACGECGSCAMARRLSHPDIHLVFPVPSTIKPDEYASILESQVRSGFREPDFGRRVPIISVETVNDEIVAKSNRRPYVGPWKVFVVSDADSMSPEAANALLKTLEEPPDDTIIVLTTSRPGALPGTIVSRCQRIPFARLRPEAIEKILTADPRLDFDGGRAREAGALARGSAGRAVRVDSKTTKSELERVAGIMTGRRTRDVGSLLSEAQALAYRLGREEQQHILDLMLLWYRDVLRLASLEESSASSGLVYSGHAGELAEQAELLSLDLIEPLIGKIDSARRAIERYSNPAIVFTSVLLDMAIARRKAADRRRAGRA